MYSQLRSLKEIVVLQIVTEPGSVCFNSLRSSGSIPCFNSLLFQLLALIYLINFVT
jgi:hypothetical protein